MQILPRGSYWASIWKRSAGEREEPIRTKLVATLGGEGGYREKYEGDKYVYTEEGEKLELSDLTYAQLVAGFYRNGVDILRMNFSHLQERGAEEVYPIVKEQILACENRNRPRGPGSLDPSRWNPKRVAILADLPGPKIRFDFAKPPVLELGGELEISLDGEKGENGPHPILVDSEPLQDAMSATDFTRLMTTIRDRLERQRVLVFVGDGDAILEVDSERFDPDRPRLPCRVRTVKVEGPLKRNRGFTLKGIDLDVPTFTRQDQQILETLVEKEYEDFGNPGWQPVLTFVALSFVQTARDVLRARQVLEEHVKRVSSMDDHEARLHAPSIIAKIETRRGVENRNLILDVADGAMVARGDLGLQVDIEEVPAIQKRLIRLCNERGKPVITATQMLASMTDSIEPTRAEVTDVFNAIQDGTDAVMCSEETAIGSYPFHAVRKMLAIAEQAERFFEYRRQERDDERRERRNQRIAELRRQRIREFLRNDAIRIGKNEERLRSELERLDRDIERLEQEPVINDDQAHALGQLRWRRGLYEEKVRKAREQETTNRITEATCMMAEAETARAILAATTSGRTVRMIARIRPRVIVIGAAHDEINTRKLLLSYGVVPLCIGTIEKTQGTEVLFDSCMGAIRRHDFLREYLSSDDKVIFTGGFPLQRPGTTNLAQIRDVAL